eukprot:TRINITY_DN2488_c0_g1_i1.p1 TRINITY_DN2488_c0_g1~~TRINITY_DN2488_c0_g1_i1.p1  ORF type:complete len:488 (+),score=43.58 TRINITY_DN2488_c0_g1_i1:49-1512(+)
MISLTNIVQSEWWDRVVFVILILGWFIIPLRIGFMMKGWRYWLPIDISFDVLQAFDSFMRRDALDQITFLNILSALPFEIVAPMAGKDYNPWSRVNRLLKGYLLLSIFAKWEKRWTRRPIWVRIHKFIFMTCTCFHILACGFALVCHIDGSDATREFTGSPNWSEEDIFHRYVHSLSWAFNSHMGSPMEFTKLQLLYTIFADSVRVLFLAMLVGYALMLISHVDSSKLYFRQKMNTINDSMSFLQIPEEVQDEVRNHYAYLWKGGRGLDKEKELSDLPVCIKQMMSFVDNSEIIKKVELLCGREGDCYYDPKFVREVVKNLKPRVFLPGTKICERGDIGSEMYFLSRGEMHVLGSDGTTVLHVLTDGSYAGEIALVYNLRRTATIVAVTCCDVFVLRKEDFQKVRQNFPAQSKNIERTAERRYKEIVPDAKPFDLTHIANTGDSSPGRVEPLNSGLSCHDSEVESIGRGTAPGSLSATVTVPIHGML